MLVANPVLTAVAQEEETEESMEETEMTEEETMEETTEESMEQSMEETMEDTSEESMEEMEVTMMESMEMQSPRMQMEEGVAAADVVCEEGLDLLIKTSTGTAACVNPMTAEILIARGWGSIPA